MLFLFLLAALFPVRAAQTTTVGLNSTGGLIQAVTAGAGRTRILLVAGSPQGAALLAREVEWVERGRSKTLSLATLDLSSLSVNFPPKGDAYRDDPASHAVWRWILVTAPDLVLVAGGDAGGLVEALTTIRARRVEPRSGILARLKPLPLPSAAHLEVDKRRARTPRQVAEQMALVYGHELNDAVYIPAFALIGRLRLGELTDVERIVSPYVNGAKNSLEKPSSSHLSGHLVFAELAARTKNPRYIELVRAAADMGFTPSGEMKESMPMHSQMSDSVFMGCPILVRAGALTGEQRYFDMALRHFRFMRGLDLRADGLWRHSPMDEAAWGRGNAFAALGMALSLEYMPAQHPGLAEMLTGFRALAAALSKQQDEGMWRQVVDLPGAYRELSATCMIGAALAKAIRRGWLDASTYQPVVDRAWAAVSARVSSDGTLLDVCESTGAQKTLSDYLKRKAIFDKDPRGGAMVLLFATQLATE